MAGGHRLPKGAEKNRSGKGGRRGNHRAKTGRPEPYAWLGAGAVTLGLGAALAGGTGVAYADDETGAGANSQSDGSSGAQSSSGSGGQPSNDPTADSPKTSLTDEDSTTGSATGTVGDELTNPDPKDSGPIDADPDTLGAEAEGEEVAAPKKNTRSGHLRGAKSGLQNRLSVESTAGAETTSAAAAPTGTVADSAQVETEAGSGAPEVTSSVQRAATMQAASLSASNVAAAAEPAASPIPKAIAVPVLKFVGGILNLFGVNTNSPLPQLDVGLAAAWTWFRQLQTDWGVAPPVAGVPSATEPDPDTGVVTGNINASNQANLPMTYKVAIDPLLGEVVVEAKTGAYTYTPSEAARLAAIVAPISDIFTVTVSNGLASNYVLVSVSIGAATSAIPNAPTSVSQSTNTATGLVTGQVGSPGWSGQPLTYTVLTPTVGGTLSFDETTGNYTYQPSALSMALASLGLATPDFFTVVANNGAIPSLPAIITVPITAMDATPTAPVSVAQSTNTATGLVTGSVSSTDPAGQALTYTVITSTLGGALTFNSSTGQYSYQPSATSMALASLGIVTTDAFTVVATNGTFISVPTIITVPITAVDAKPSTPAAGPLTTNAATGLVTGSVSSTDPAGQPLTYTVITSTLGGTLTLNAATGAFTYTPSAAARVAASAGVTTDVFTVVATNGTFTSGLATITVPIAPNPSPPSAPVKGSHTIDTGNGRVTSSVSSTDPAGLPLTYSVTTGAVSGTVVMNSNGSFTYTPTAAARGASWAAGGLNDVFTVTVSNGYTSNFAVITVPISPKRPF